MEYRYSFLLHNPGSKYWEEEPDGVNHYVVHVPYDQGIWFFYINKSTFKMSTYIFYKDEPARKGKIIYPEGEMMIGPIRILKSRKWGPQLMGTPWHRYFALHKIA